jgi:hypothetical protein
MPNALVPALGKDRLCRVPTVALGKIFFLFFVAQFFVGPLYSTWKSMFKFGVFFTFLIYFVNFFFVSLNFFECFKFELQVHGIMVFSDSKKMIFVIFSACWGRIQELTWNFERIVPRTGRGTCGKSVFKLYKIQRSLKMTKLVEVSCYRIWRLW